MGLFLGSIIEFNNLLLLRDAGLIHESDSLVIIFQVMPELINESVLWIGTDIFQVSYNDTNKKEYKFNQIKLTLAGVELAKFLAKDKNKDYFEKLISEKEEEGYTFIKIPFAVS